MTSLKSALTAAAGDGIITADQALALEPYLNERGISSVSPVEADEHDVLTDARLAEDSEQPRFVRGFHDILITIGVVVALVGVWGLGSAFAVFPAVLLLAEILVRRQRLALPAVVLTLALVQATAIAAALLIDEGAGPVFTEGLKVLPVIAVALGVFYWRYRVPLALSLLFLSLAAFAMCLVFTVLEKVTGSANLLIDYSTLSAGVFLVFALAVFGVAMAYDVSDPHRRTRLSDVAFWMHLAAAPMLLYAMLSFVFLKKLSGDWWNDSTLFHAITVVLIVAVFMAIGLVIDRRAFVTSGLVSLGLAIWTILSRGQAVLSDYASVTVLLVGIVVLSIGVFWQSLRRLTIRPLPDMIKAYLHPAL
ncbi:hypothetical protein QO002_003374 [Pararhizobium capsulatum DSM 1112]|uniref:DUF2157 domain-containing protein n=1 Tax=Pararhizobium capsulatum DSM 1112 TaxID=1121113 RepID=A0ABU0BSJ8_9HYPH|nr:hypothetical protein [Pararhizobium capsulatum]MDQ0321236.1 hypothetical protein [Pararhizobium capsulatum DSM 1112]